MPRDVAPVRKGPLVCVLGMRGIPGVMGGVESHCEELLPRLAARAPDLRFVAFGRRAYIGDRQTTFRGVRVIPVNAPKRQSVETLVSSLLAVLRARRMGAAAVHIHAVASGLIAPIAKLLGMKVILTIHGADYLRAKWGPAARAVLRLGEWFGVRNADAVICVAPSLTQQLCGRYPARSSRIEFVPNGAPPLHAVGNEGEVLRRFGLERGEFVLAVGRIEPGKGFEILIDAFRKSGRQGKLAIVGGAQHEGDYAAALMNSADERVVFTGAQPREVLAHLYRAAALFVLPSLHEGLPICALEAGSVSCPLLLSDIPGNRDLGLADMHYFRSGHVAALSRALREPASHYAVSPEMFAAFEWNQIANQTLAIYDSVIGHGAEVRSYAAA